MGRLTRIEPGQRLVRVVPGGLVVTMTAEGFTLRGLGKTDRKRGRTYTWEQLASLSSTRISSGEPIMASQERETGRHIMREVLGVEVQKPAEEPVAFAVGQVWERETNGKSKRRVIVAVGQVDGRPFLRWTRPTADPEQCFKNSGTKCWIDPQWNEWAAEARLVSTIRRRKKRKRSES